MSDALGALCGLKEVGNQRNRYGQECDELITDVGEGCLESLKGCREEGPVREGRLEEGPDLGEFGFFAEGGIEEDVPEEID